ncbi:hypothetical protein D3C73_1195500 [compost metagenome]
MSTGRFVGIKFPEDPIEGRLRRYLQSVVFGPAFVKRLQLLDDGIDHFGFTGGFFLQIKFINLLFDDLLKLPRLMVQTMFHFLFPARN